MHGLTYSGGRLGSLHVSERDSCCRFIQVLSSSYMIEFLSMRKRLRYAPQEQCLTQFLELRLMLLGWFFQHFLTHRNNTFERCIELWKDHCGCKVRFVVINFLFIIRQPYFRSKISHHTFDQVILSPSLLIELQSSE